METGSCILRRDRLSNLPEHIIHHILSYLDMTFVIPTSFLSRRFRNIWYSLPSLTLNQHVFRSCLSSDSNLYNRFPDFVNMVFLLRDSSPIQSLTLVLDDDKCRKTNLIENWIHTAIIRNVREIVFQFECGYLFYDYPYCLFTSKSLTSLKLCLLCKNGYDRTIKVALTAKISLPCLKSLHLDSANFKVNEKFFGVLFLGCPALETLILMRCKFRDSEVLSISSLQLKHLHIDMTYADNELMEVFVIRASNLLEFSWRSLGWSVFSLDGLSSLETANINLEQCYSYVDREDRKYLELSDGKAGKGMVECLKGLYNVKHLTLSSDCLQIISELPSEIEKWPTQFSNLRHLNLQSWLTRGCFDVTMFLLEKSPNIETLVLRMEPIESEKTVEHGVLESSLDLKLHHLKVVKLSNVNGCKNELQHLRILLGNSEVLEKITIVKSEEGVSDSEEWGVFTVEVLALHRASPDARIIFQATGKMDC